jgi:hypothetical protein
MKHYVLVLFNVEFHKLTKWHFLFRLICLHVCCGDINDLEYGAIENTLLLIYIWKGGGRCDLAVPSFKSAYATQVMNTLKAQTMVKCPVKANNNVCNHTFSLHHKEKLLASFSTIFIPFHLYSTSS